MEQEPSAQPPGQLSPPWPWTKSSTTPIRDLQDSVFSVIHPFHPLHGRKFKLVNYTLCWGEGRVYFYDDEGRLSSLPAKWTSVGPKDVFAELSKGRSSFRLEDLLELANLLRGAADNV